MNPAHPDDQTRFYLDQRGPTWADLARIKYFRLLVNNSTARLATLTQDPDTHEDRIRSEQALLNNARRTLKRLEDRQRPA